VEAAAPAVSARIVCPPVVVAQKTCVSLILVIDDDVDNREFIAALLEARGHVVVVASQGERGLAVLDAIAPARPDLIVMDMMMPVLDGIGFLRAYAARTPPCAPVVAMSAFGPYLEEATALGARAVLTKPLDTAELLELVADAAAGRAITASPPHPLRDAEVERHRLQELVRLSLEGPPQKALEPFVERVARIFEVESCLVSIVTEARQYWTAACNMPASHAQARGGPREQSFCAHAVVAHTALIVQDAHENPLFVHNPFVTQEGVRFYAGVPLVSEHGAAVGTLCLLDRRPHVFGHFDLELLSILGRRVVSALEGRRDEYVDLELGIPGRACLIDLATVEAWRCAAKGEACTLVAVDGDPLAQVKDRLAARLDRAWIGRLDAHRLGLVVPGMSPSEAQGAALGATTDTRVAAVDLNSHIGVAVTAFGKVESALDG
jgi:CheY-like chemotaxis protein